MDTPDQCIDDMTLALYDVHVRAHEGELEVLRARSGATGMLRPLDDVAPRAMLARHLQVAHDACVALADAARAGTDDAAQRHVARRALRVLDAMVAQSRYAHAAPGAVTTWRVRCADLLALLYPDGDVAAPLPEQDFFADPA